jgi:actin
VSILVAEERYRCPEVLFQPPLLGLECDGIHQMIFNAINKTDPAMHKQLWKGIVLAGGNTMFPGLQARLQKELTALAPKDCEVGIMAPPDRKYSAFGGASLMASSASFQKYWITKELYDDYGPSICEMKQKEIDMGPA